MAGPSFFMREPQAGRPLAMRGLALGLVRMARALRFMSVHNGHVDWHGWIPKIVFDGAETEGADLPSGGDQYQVLAKKSSADGDAHWDWVRAAEVSE